MQSVLRRTISTRSTGFLRYQPSVSSKLSWRTFPVRTLITKRYTKDHECVVFDDSTGLGIISITDHAQDALGDVVFVELPQVGSTVQQEEQIGAVESVKAASDIYAPVSGTVEAVNELLDSQPGLLNKSPEDKGWLCKIKLSDPSELEKLMNEEEYKASYEH